MVPGCPGQLLFGEFTHLATVRVENGRFEVTGFDKMVRRCLASCVVERNVWRWALLDVFAFVI